MYICICHAVTDREIKHAAKSGATSLDDLRKALNVATNCGRCSGCARELLKEFMASAAQLEAQVN